MPVVPDGKPMDPARFAKAVAAAAIDDELEAEAVKGWSRTEAFDRRHVEELRAAGCTREDARDYFLHVFGDRKVSRSAGGRERVMVTVADLLMDDLDSYGDWNE